MNITISGELFDKISVYHYGAHIVFGLIRLRGCCVLMATHLSKYFKKRRIEMGLKTGQLARLVGYRNLSKGIRRITEFETTGAVHPVLFQKLTAALEVEQETIKRLLKNDYGDWSRWADEPVMPYLVLRIMPAFYTQLNLPESVCSTKEAERFASITARRYHKKCCLVLSRRISIWIDADGMIENTTEAVFGGEPNTPFMQIAGKPFLVKEIDHSIAIKRIDLPRGFIGK